jgi:hypothetical protein
MITSSTAVCDTSYPVGYLNLVKYITQNKTILSHKISHHQVSKTVTELNTYKITNKRPHNLYSSHAKQNNWVKMMLVKTCLR